MGRQRTAMNVMGMARDMALERTQHNMAYENLNVRLTATDENHTMTAITNEKGTENIGVTVYGTPNGTFVCNNYFGIFSHSDDNDLITVYQRADDGSYSEMMRYVDEGHKFEFGDNYIEAIVSVESSKSIRVYWIDGEHEMRVIDFMKLYEKYKSINTVNGVVVVTSSTLPQSYFSYLPNIERITVKSIDKISTGYFYSGTAQFVITELINGNESNIVYYSPLYYVSNDSQNRGFAPDNTTDGIGFMVSFLLNNTSNSKVTNYFVYCIHRTMKDGVATVFMRKVTATNGLMTAIFTGEEETVDSTYLSFKNTGKMTGVKTFVQKDNTLFVGNYNINTVYNENIETFLSSVGSIGIGFRDAISGGTFNGTKYTHNSQLSYNSYQIGHFKNRETYILGYQLMDETGAWSEPVFLESKKMTNAPKETGDGVKLPYFYSMITKNTNYSGSINYKAARPVVAYLSDARKRCLYQGYMTPTIFCEQERLNSITYAKFSPFARTMRYLGASSTKVNPQLTGNVNPIKNSWWSTHNVAYHFSHPFNILQGSGSDKFYQLDKELASADLYSSDSSWETERIHSYLGYGATYTIKAYDDYYVEDMKLGTYPANQHWSALGSAKDYNCEIQSQVTHTDVIFKTAVYPICYSTNDTVASTTTNNEESNSVIVYKETVKITTYTSETASTTTTVTLYYYYNDGTKTYIGATGIDTSKCFEGEDGYYGTSYTDSNSNTVYYTVEDIIGINPNKTQAALNTFRQSHTVESIQDASKDTTTTITGTTVADYTGSNVSIFNIDNTKYYVDASVVTFQSPDITQFVHDSDADSKVQIIGAIAMNGFTSDCSIVAQTPNLFADTIGNEGFQNIKPSNTTSGRCAMTLPNWCAAWSNGGDMQYLYWAVYPWGRDRLGQSNNDSAGTVEQSKLTYKQLANYRFSDKTLYYTNDNDLTTYQDTDGLHFVTGEQSSITRVRGQWYKGAEDVVVNQSPTLFVTNGLTQRIYATENMCIAPLIWAQADRSHMMNGLNLISCNGDTTKYNFVALSSIQHRNKHTVTSDKHYSYMGYWRNNGAKGGDIIKTLYNWNDTIINAVVAHLNDSDYYHDADYTVRYENGKKNIEKAYTNGHDWGNSGKYDKDDAPTAMMTNLKYDATPHYCIDLGKNANSLKNILPNTGYALNFLQSKAGNFFTGYISLESQTKQNFATACPYDYTSTKALPDSYSGDAIWIADILRSDYTDDDSYNADTDNNETTPWYIAGESVWFEDTNTPVLKWVQGNWYFQRWENLRTYAESSSTDVNQYVEIVSCMLETRTNIDGRYDANRGIALLNASPSNFGLINESYSQQNNFFTYYRTSLVDNNKVTSYPNTIAWSLPKILNSEVDNWTAITGQSYIDMDGDKGSITKLCRFANDIFSLQPRGVAQILYNSRTQLSTEDGTPVEIGNSGKVEGKRYVSNMIGAQNKRQVLTTDSGIYFADQYNKTLMLFSDKMNSLSEVFGFHSWAAQNYNQTLYHYWDAKHKSVMIINVNEALSFSEILQNFESFFDYGETFEVLNIINDTLLIHTGTDGLWYVWRMNGGEYNSFFGQNKDWRVKYAVSTDVASEQASQQRPTDKIWDNVEYRGDVYDGTEFKATVSPYTYIRAETEYQDTEEQKLTFKKDFHQNISNLKQKFRIWHGIIPRDKKDHKAGHIHNRIRNPWVYLTLGFRQSDVEDGERNYRAIVQDLYIDFFE